MPPAAVKPTFRRVALIGKLRSPEIAASLQELSALLKARGCEVLVERETADGRGADYETIGKGADLAVVTDGLRDERRVMYHYFTADSCDIAEGVIPAPGWRRLLTFSAIVRNATAMTRLAATGRLPPVHRVVATMKSVRERNEEAGISPGPMLKWI